MPTEPEDMGQEPYKMYLESQSTSENGYKYLFLWDHVPFSKVL